MPQLFLYFSLNRTTFTHNEYIRFELLTNVVPKVKKCYHCKVIQNLTDTKLRALQQEFDRLQHYLQTKQDLGLYSANKQQADRFYKVVKTGKKYPLSIRNDLIRIEHNPDTIAEYWCRIPVKIARGDYGLD